jgi:hypothetical protein
MKLGLVGPSYQERSLPFDAQRTINLYPALDESQQGKEVSALYGTPGLALFNTFGLGPIRGMFSSTNGRAFAVSRSEFYEIFEDGSSTLRGTLNSSFSNVTMEENPTQLAICDGEDIYIFTYGTDAFTTPSLPFTPALTLGYLDGYFVANTTMGQFYISDLYDGSSWNALDFATAEGTPDGLVRVFGALGQLWLLGDRTTEIWYNSADVDFPFARQPGARMETGLAAAHTVVCIDNTIVWLGKNKDGQGTVYRAAGFTPQRISTFAIEYQINKSTDLSGIRAYAYQQDGHLFYCLTGGNLETTLCMDLSTGLWHERAYLEETGLYSTHLATTCVYAFGKHLVGDKTRGNIYEMSLDYLDDAGRPIKATRVFTHLSNEGKPFTINRLQVDFEYGVGTTTGQGEDPVAHLRISRDGARTWGPLHTKRIGKMGQYLTRCEWRRLGITNDIITYEITISDPVRRAICGAYAD